MPVLAVISHLFLCTIKILGKPFLDPPQLKDTTESTDAAACVFHCFSNPQKDTINSGTSTRLPVSNWELEERQKDREYFTLFGHDET